MCALLLGMINGYDHVCSARTASNLLGGSMAAMMKGVILVLSQGKKITRDKVSYWYTCLCSQLTDEVTLH